MADSGPLQGGGERSVLLSVSSKAKPALKARVAEPKWVVTTGMGMARSQRELARARQLLGNEKMAYWRPASTPLPPHTTAAATPAGAPPAVEVLGTHARSLSAREAAMEKALARDDSMIHQLRSRWNRSKRTRQSKERARLRVKAEEQVL